MHGDHEAKAGAIEDAVKHTHRVVLYATAAIALLVKEDAENAGVAASEMLPLADQGKVYSMFAAVTDSKGPDPTKNPANFAVYQRVREAHQRIHADAKGGKAPLVSGKGMSTLLNYEARQYATSVKTSLTVHFTKRVKRFFLLRLRDELRPVLSQEAAHERPRAPRKVREGARLP